MGGQTRWPSMGRRSDRTVQEPGMGPGAPEVSALVPAQAAAGWLLLSPSAGSRVGVTFCETSAVLMLT